MGTDTLSRSANSEMQIVLCGPKSSGKTVLLTAIFGCGVNIKTADDRTTQILQSDWKRLESGQSWPGATELGVRELSFTYNDRAFKVGLKINDYDGQLSEVLSLAAENPDIAANLVLFRNMVRSASGLVFLFPYGEQTDDLRMRKFRDEINTFLTLVEEGAVNREPLSLPVVLAVNKWDRSPHFGALDERVLAEQFLESTPVYRDAARRLRAFLPNTVVVPVAVVRPTGDGGSTPEEISPHNLLEPIRYIVEFVFSKFEAEYGQLPTEPTPEADKAKYMLMSGYFKEIRNYKSYGAEYAAIESRIAARFESEFSQLGPRDIDTRKLEEGWFFAGNASDGVHAKFQHLQDDALEGVFDVGLRNASSKGLAELELWRKEDGWLFDRLAEKPEYLARYEAARTRLVSALNKKSRRKWLIVAAAAPLLMLGAWTAYANVDETSRYKLVTDIDVSSPAAVTRCNDPSKYLKTYGPGTLHPPLLFVDSNRRNVRKIDDALKAQFSAQILSTIDGLKNGSASSIDEAAAQIATLDVMDACLEPGRGGAGQDPKSVLAEAKADLDLAREFMTEWRTLQGMLPPSACPDITRAQTKSDAFDGLSTDVTRAKSTLVSRFAVCDDKAKCATFMDELDRASSFSAFNALFAGDPRRQQCENMYAREGMSAVSMFVAARNKTFERLDRQQATRLKQDYSSTSELSQGQAALDEMSGALQATPGLNEPYFRPGDIVSQVSRAQSALSTYSNLNSIYVTSFEFQTNAGESSSRNPLSFGCNAYAGSKARNAWITFAGLRIRSENRNCFNSGSSSAVRERVSLYLAHGSYRLQILKDDTGREFTATVTVTRDDLFKLRSSGYLTYYLDNSAYSVTLRSR